MVVRDKEALPSVTKKINFTQLTLTPATCLTTAAAAYTMWLSTLAMTGASNRLSGPTFY
jgi:hypothetical protein